MISVLAASSSRAVLARGGRFRPRRLLKSRRPLVGGDDRHNRRAAQLSRCAASHVVPHVLRPRCAAGLLCRFTAVECGRVAGIRVTASSLGKREWYGGSSNVELTSSYGFDGGAGGRVNPSGRRISKARRAGPANRGRGLDSVALDLDCRSTPRPGSAGDRNRGRAPLSQELPSGSRGWVDRASFRITGETATAAFRPLAAKRGGDHSDDLRRLAARCCAAGFLRGLELRETPLRAVARAGTR